MAKKGAVAADDFEGALRKKYAKYSMQALILEKNFIDLRIVEIKAQDGGFTALHMLSSEQFNRGLGTTILLDHIYTIKLHIVDPVLV